MVPNEERGGCFEAWGNRGTSSLGSSLLIQVLGKVGLEVKHGCRKGFSE